MMGEGGTKDTGVPPALWPRCHNCVLPHCVIFPLCSPGSHFHSEQMCLDWFRDPPAQTPEPCELRLRPDIWLDLITISQVRLPGLS